ncbi:MAG: DUF1315 family protein [Pseudomonas sp.]
MDYQQLITAMTPELYEGLKRAVELGKWPNGERLNAQQRESCLQAVIAYDHLHKREDERVGYIHTEKHEHCGEDGGSVEPDAPQPLKWRDQ